MIILYLIESGNAIISGGKDKAKKHISIMSLGGIAIAVGTVVDAAIVMIENAHNLERWQPAHPKQKATSQEHWQLIATAASEVGAARFFSLLIITLSFIPVFTLEAQEGRLFSPLSTEA